MKTVRLNNLDLKYKRYKLSGCKDIGIITFEFVVKTQFLCFHSMLIVPRLVKKYQVSRNKLNFKNLLENVQSRILNILAHPGLTRVRGIRFLLFEIIRVLVYILTIFKLTDLFVIYFLLKVYMPAKKYLRKKAEKLCLIGRRNCDGKSQLSGILTEPINPRDLF